VRVRGLRAERRLSLDALATRSGVSRSMISLVERGEASPTAIVLDRLATGLGVPLASLFETPDLSARSVDPVARQVDQPPWRDPASGYLRRNVSPAVSGSPIQIVDVLFPAGARVAYETGPREPMVHQQVWVLQGVIEVSVGERTHHLSGGDCLAFVLDEPVMFHNPTDEPTRYAVVLVSQPAHRRSSDRRQADAG
jgi:transcriptional regulator with XRE-family HTH domain